MVAEQVLPRLQRFVSAVCTRLWIWSAARAARMALVMAELVMATVS